MITHYFHSNFLKGDFHFEMLQMETIQHILVDEKIRLYFRIECTTMIPFVQNKLCISKWKKAWKAYSTSTNCLRVVGTQIIFLFFYFIPIFYLRFYWEHVLVIRKEAKKDPMNEWTKIKKTGSIHTRPKHDFPWTVKFLFLIWGFQYFPNFLQWIHITFIEQKTQLI